IFMDINMPVMDGYTATIKIRHDSRYNQLPIIALSALTSVSEVDNMFTTGMNGYLAKPLKKEKLFTVFTLFVTKRAENNKVEEREEKTITQLDGLNIKLGISQSSSSEVFYKEILLEFKDAYSHSSDVFEKLVTDFRYEQLRMLCLDLKGLSGAIGAQDMQNLTTEVLQKLLFKKYELIPSFVEKYSKELKKLNKSIDEYTS
ncbi:MAG: response regulator, partial [Sulfurimonas sp.]|nr:response regulator [Sulfurimonas sp.]